MTTIQSEENPRTSGQTSGVGHGNYALGAESCLLVGPLPGSNRAENAQTGTDCDPSPTAGGGIGEQRDFSYAA
ncbi:MAG TPA: hypothetical protein VF898_08460 [Chloroflexota bacterium]